MTAHSFSPGTAGVSLSRLAQREAGAIERLPIIDAFGRQVTYLRISVTDACNLRCVYCMPAGTVDWLPRNELLTYEEIARVAQVAANHGVNKFRITGGEPLARSGLPDLIRRIYRIPGIRDVALTTNGTLLARHALALKEAGLSRVNVSLDSLIPERYSAITGGGRLDNLWEGIDAAIRAGLSPVKVNVVVLKGVNEGEVSEMAALSLNRKIEVRFIEYMPLGESNGCSRVASGFEHVPSSETKARIEAKLGVLAHIDHDSTFAGPAQRWKLPDSEGSIGFISAMSSPFCGSCNRLRLTAQGEIRSCLLNGGQVSIKALLRGDGGEHRIYEALQSAAMMRPREHQPWTRIADGQMHMIGG